MNPEPDDISAGPLAIAMLAGTYVDDSPTTESLVAATVAAGCAQTSRWIERLRDDGMLAVVEMRSRGWAEGRYAVNAADAPSLVLAAVQMRAAKVKTEDIVVRLALAGHDIPRWRVLKALRNGVAPYQRLLQIAARPDHHREADRLVNGLERSRAKREQFGVDVALPLIDGFVRDLFDEALAMITGAAFRTATAVPAMLCRVFRLQPHEEDVLKRAGMGSLIDECVTASRRIRDGVAALDDVAEGDMPRILRALSLMIAIRDGATRAGEKGDAFAAIVGRGFSFVTLESALGLFLAYVFMRMIDELSKAPKVEAAPAGLARGDDLDCGDER